MDRLLPFVDMASSRTNGDSPGPPSRATRRRERTRAQLLEAAGTLFARQGIEATRINEITDEADVGFGSFYNHFTSKDDIVAAVLERTVVEHAEAVDAMTGELDNPAEVVAMAHRYFVRLARTDPSTAWLIVRLELTHGVLRSALGERATRDVQRGIEAGRFAVPDAGVALLASGGALIAVMRGVLEGELGANADVHHAEGVLKMLGVRRADAAKIARRAIPA